MDAIETSPTGSPDIRQFRQAEFRRLIRKPLVIGPALLGAIFGGYVGSVIGPLFAVVGLLLFPVVIALIVVLVSRAKATRTFLIAYATARGLAPVPSEEVRQAVPLLRKGYRRDLPEVFSGRLEPGVEGQLALYTFFTPGSGQDSSETPHDFTVVITEIPETAESLPELLVWRKSGLRILEKVEDVFRRNHQRVQIENPTMVERYEVFVGKEQDPLEAFELLSSDLIGLLTGTVPKGFAFELVDGQLCCYVARHLTDAGEIDRLVAVSAGVAGQLRRQASS